MTHLSPPDDDNTAPPEELGARQAAVEPTLISALPASRAVADPDSKTRAHAALTEVEAEVAVDDRDEVFMRTALTEAEAAAAAGDVPVGAVIVSATGQILAYGRNRREQDNDPTAHAEVDALRAAARLLSTWRMEGAILYVTLEPCPMCAGALVNARIARLVYGCSDPKAGAVDTLFTIGRDTRLNHRFAVTSGVLAGESAALLRAFFAARRRKAAPARSP